MEKSDTTIGIDEVARSPVLGSMIIAGVGVANGFNYDKFKELNIKDSKLLNKKEIKVISESLFGMDGVVIKYRIITGRMISDSINLNTLEARHAASIIKAFRAESKPSNIYIDNCDRNRSIYADRLKRFLTFGSNEKYIIEHKADENYPIVSAASIVAKYISNKEMDNLRGRYDFGSGQPNDNKTRKFIKSCIMNKRIPHFVRTNWKTFKDLCHEVKRAKEISYIKDSKTLRKRLKELEQTGAEDSIMKMIETKRDYAKLLGIDEFDTIILR